LASIIAISVFPVFLFLPLHCRCVGVLHFEPIGRPARTIGGVLPLRHDTFEAEFAGVPKYGLAVAFHVLVESNTRPSLRQNNFQHGLASLRRIASEIVPIRVQEYAVVMMAVANEIERSDAVVITGNRLPIDDAGARGQAGQGLDNQGKTIS
jgi:hypothetical protein